MSWDFETEPGFAAQLDWIEAFVRDEVEPPDHVVEDPYDAKDSVRAALIPPLQHRVRAQGLWACHLSPKLGGEGYGQVKLALINEILGRSRSAPVSSVAKHRIQAIAKSLRTSELRSSSAAGWTRCLPAKSSRVLR
jgi:alkylation response protein AidB-like acyl-CoA dehydrogenase